ncbi:Ysc84p KNAG_0I01580 [Huiozyma naganishii CBS 8797]|uniref:SH3 domain-containing protein n=1 Tax=Huiozyma naganishii (strain ATCC MYA-139 / BCRC 22969 / CBS 8797 / KCTC 17520 / NBRC 10181 / NCYC 3082 / Yp74L-3) TaxID=1071383 RepID=J7RAP3_HUIN7|nr:hypothetical protein KNAG_0I01580 [Kazachstania naganishii CBS 8797]CCK71945.1 hypothetical protein KNAG_0I01580 [Kazachstania naganishii CBS 8797]
MGLNNPIPRSLSSEASKAAKVLASFVKPNQVLGQDQVIPPSVLKEAKGLAIITVLKAGFLFSGRAGSGVIVARLDDRSWSAPSAIGMAGAGAGGLIGVELTDFVFILNSEEAVRSFSEFGTLTLGGNMSVSAGPLGRNAEMDASASMGGVAAVFAYSKSKGLFAGVSVEGSMIVERREANRKFYGDNCTSKQILSGQVHIPPGTEPLYQILHSRAFNYSNQRDFDDQFYDDIPDSFSDRNFLPPRSRGNQDIPCDMQGDRYYLDDRNGQGRARYDQGYDNQNATYRGDRNDGIYRDDNYGRQRDRDYRTDNYGRQSDRDYRTDNYYGRQPDNDYRDGYYRQNDGYYGADHYGRQRERRYHDNYYQNNSGYGANNYGRPQDRDYPGGNYDNTRSRNTHDTNNYPRYGKEGEDKEGGYRRYHDNYPPNVAGHDRTNARRPPPPDTHYGTGNNNITGQQDNEYRYRSEKGYPPDNNRGGNLSGIYEGNLRNTGGGVSDPRGFSTYQNAPPSQDPVSPSLGHPSEPNIAKAVALFDFGGAEPGDLTFKKGDVITIIKRSQSQNDWWLGRINEREGLFPANYVECV